MAGGGVEPQKRKPRKRSTARKSAAKKVVDSLLGENPVEEDVMDGAVFPYNKDQTPEFFMANARGERRNGYKTGTEWVKPHNTAYVNLTNGLKEKVIPPRSVWVEGKWKSEKTTGYGRDFYTWIVSGEGTPGAYEKREYELPNEVCTVQIPAHPADWEEKLRRGKADSSVGSGNWGTSSTKTAASSSGLPYGLRIRCVGCGHFFKESDLGDHAKNACPSIQGEPVLWIMECECHKGDLFAATKILEGFPVKPKAPDTSPEADDKKEGAADEAGGSVEPASEASPAVG